MTAKRVAVDSAKTGGSILVLEDDPHVAGSLVRGLREEGYAPQVASCLAEARVALDALHPGLIILDLGLADGDGLSLLRDLRRAGDPVPVIILTARDAVSDRVAGLDQGADDYLVKPFSFAELLARVRARLRVLRQGEESQVLRVGSLEVDRLNRVVRRGGRAIDLTAREFDLLAFLAHAPGYPVSREMLAREVWKVNSRATPLDNVIDVHVSHLREKIDRDFGVKLIRTVRGVGFALAEDAP